jgi:Uma2 family endonuclease
MAIVIARGETSYTVPLWVSDLESFRRWTHSEEYPAQSKALYYDGEVFLDEPPEKQLHGEIKAAIAAAIRFWSDQHLPGMTYLDKMRFTHALADLSSEPDVMFVSDESIEAGTVTLQDGDEALEVEGSPDVVVEIISPSSFQKDSITLKRKYAEAGVREYWLADSRTIPSLTVYKRQGKRFVPVAADAQGWLRSSVLGAKCRLLSKTGRGGITKVTLEMKAG